MRLTILLALAAAGCRGTDERHCLLDEVDPAFEVVEVEVTTTTGREGTDSDVFLDVEIAGASDQALYLDDPGSDNFEAFSTETFSVPVSPFAAGDVERMQIRKDSSLFEAGDWRLDGLTVAFVDASGDSALAYDNPDGVEHLTGDEDKNLRCP